MSDVRWSVVLFVVAAVVVSFTFTDYGVTWDEAFHVRYGNGVYEYFASGFHDRESFLYLDLYYYGAAFDLMCAVGQRLSPFAVYDTRHLLNAFVALVGVLGSWFLARELGTARTAFLAALLLLLTPRFWGHGFNNPKDIPFAAGYVWSIYFLVRVMPTLPRVPIRLALATGLAIGMTLAIPCRGPHALRLSWPLDARVVPGRPAHVGPRQTTRDELRDDRRARVGGDALVLAVGAVATFVGSV